MGYKMARDGKVEIWIGMWLSSAVLLPLGVFFTYKALRDSAVFNPDAYRTALRRLLGLRESRTALMIKEVRIHECEPAVAVGMIASLRDYARSEAAMIGRRPSYVSYLTKGLGCTTLPELSVQLEDTVAYISNSTQLDLLNLASNWPTLPWLWIYRPFPAKWMGLTAAAIFPVGLCLYIAGLIARKRLLSDLNQIAETKLPDSLNLPHSL